MMEKRIASLEAQIAELKQLTFEQDIYEDYIQINDILKQIQLHETSLETLEQDYLTLLAQLERNEV